VVEEALAGGRFLIAPEWPSKEISADAILERTGGRRMSPRGSTSTSAICLPRRGIVSQSSRFTLPIKVDEQS